MNRLSSQLITSMAMFACQAFGCARASKDLQMTTRRAIDARLSIALPDNWEIWEPSDDIVFVYPGLRYAAPWAIE